MTKLDAVALESARTNIMLDTTVGTPAEMVYPRLESRRVGMVERYGIHPLTRELVGEMWFAKDLNIDAVL